MQPLPSLLLRVSAAAAVSAAIVSCGSRTGLFGPDPSAVLDAALDVPTLPDAGVDADARADVTVDAPVPCVPGTFDFQLAIGQLMFVLDRSGSMSFSLTRDEQPPPGRPTRWTTLRDSLTQVIVPLDQQLAMGAKFFPEANADPFSPAGACVTSRGVGIPPALGNAQAIIDVFASTSPVGGTPTAAALQQAAQYLASSRSVARAMVLATDGAPNCNGNLDAQTCTCTSSSGGCAQRPDGQYNCLDDVATVAVITDAFTNRKIPVYVIGIGGITFGSVLDAMAVAGGRPRAGTPKYLPATTAAELTTAFQEVRDSVAKCTYLTPSAPKDPDAVEVVIGGAKVPRDPTHVEGWDWIDQAYGQLQLFGAACTTATPSNVSGTISCRDE